MISSYGSDKMEEKNDIRNKFGYNLLDELLRNLKENSIYKNINRVVIYWSQSL
jgi:hypothetical protein